MKSVYTLIQFVGLLVCLSTLGPIAGIILIILGGLGYRKEVNSINCPSCQKRISKKAKFCKHCKGDLTKVAKEDADEKKAEGITAGKWGSFKKAFIAIFLILLITIFLIFLILILGSLREEGEKWYQKYPEPRILSEVEPNVSWINESLKVLFIYQRVLYQISLPGGKTDIIHNQADDFFFSPSGNKIYINYNITVGVTHGNYDIFTIYNLKSGKKEFTKTYPTNCMFQDFVDDNSFIMVCDYDYILVNFIFDSSEKISKTSAKKYLENGKNIYNKPFGEECASTQKDAVISFDEFEKGYYSPDCNMYIRKCVNSSPESIEKEYCLYSNNFKVEKPLVKVIPEKPGEQFGPYYGFPDFFGEAWSKDIRFLLYSFGELIYVYDVQREKSGYLAQGHYPKFYESE